MKNRKFIYLRVYKTVPRTLDSYSKSTRWVEYNINRKFILKNIYSPLINCNYVIETRCFSILQHPNDPNDAILIEKEEYTRETLLFVELISLRKLDEFPRSLARSMVLLSFSLFHDNEKQQEEDRLLPSNEPRPTLPLLSVKKRLCSVQFRLNIGAKRSIHSIPRTIPRVERRKKKRKTFASCIFIVATFPIRDGGQTRGDELCHFSKSSFESKWFWV